MASKSEVLRRAPVCVRWGIPRERGRPARILIPANSLPCHSLARRTKPAFTGISSIVPVFVRAGRPRSRASAPAPYSCKQTPALLARRTKPGLCGRDARALCSQVVFMRARRPRSQVVFVRAGRPRSQVGFTPSPRPTLGGSLSSILQRLSGPLAVLRAPSWIALFAFLWISYVSWLCSSATISRATSRARSGWPGGREMAATTGWPPPP